MDRKTYISLLLLLCSGICAAIYHSSPAREHQFPYLVSLRNARDEHIDGGVILTKRLVLTYGSTLKTHSPTAVRAGSRHLDNGTRFDIDQLLTHPRATQFWGPRLRHALGIIRIRGEFAFDDATRPIRLSERDVSPKMQLTTAGWGRTRPGVDRVDELHFAKFHPAAAEDCQALLRELHFEGYFYEGAFCNKGLSHDEARWCWWDAGGPLVTKGEAEDELVGITYNPEDCVWHDKSPNLAFKVKDYLDWIREQIEKDKDEEEAKSDGQ